MIAGVTGKYCAGKDAVSEILEQFGFISVDEDGIGHRALDVKRDAVIGAFGPYIKSPDGSIDRSKLGSLVFSRQMNLKRLEHILHPWMVAETAKLLETMSGKNALINAAILFRMGLHTLCNFVIVVKAPLVIRIFRGLKRDTRGVWHVFKRMRFQPRFDIHGQFLKKQGIPVDMYTVRNRGSRKALVRRVSRILAHNGISGR